MISAINKRMIHFDMNCSAKGITLMMINKCAKYIDKQNNS